MRDATATTAPDADPRRPPSAVAVFRQHLALVGRAGVKDLVGFFLVACAFYVAAAVDAHGSTTRSYADRALGVEFAALVFAAYWPLAVWRDLPPRRRAHFRSLPVSPVTNALLRVAAGLCFLILVTAAANLGAAALGIAMGRGGEFAAISPLAWLGYGLGLTIVYLLGSTAAVASDYPSRWVLLLIVFVYAPPLLLKVPDELAFTLRVGPTGLYRGAFGLDTATRWVVTEAQLDAPLTEFDTGRWLLATAVWLLVSTTLVFAAARRRADV